MSSEHLKIIIGASTVGFSAAMLDAGKALSGLKTAALGVTALVGMAFVDMGKKVIEVGSEFDLNMRIVSNITRASAEDMEVLRLKTLEMGSTTIFSSKEASDALVMMSRAGITDVKDATEALYPILQLAKAGFMETTEAVNVAINILNQYGLEVTDLTKLNDVLTYVAHHSNTTIQQLSTAFTYAGTMASEMGMDIYETAGILGLLAGRGIKASMAGTTLRQSIMRLINPTAESARILQKYGLTIYNSEGEMRNYVDILKDMIDSHIDLNDAAELLGARASQIATLFKGGVSGLEDFIEKTREAEGETKKFTSNLEDSFWGRMKIMKNKLGNVYIGLFNAIAPVGMALMENIGKALDKAFQFLTNNRETVSKFFGDMARVAAQAAGTVVSIVMSIVGFVTKYAGIIYEKLLFLFHPLDAEYLKAALSTSPEEVQKTLDQIEKSVTEFQKNPEVKKGMNITEQINFAESTMQQQTYWKKVLSMYKEYGSQISMGTAIKEMTQLDEAHKGLAETMENTGKFLQNNASKWGDSISLMFGTTGQINQYELDLDSADLWTKEKTDNMVDSFENLWGEFELGLTKMNQDYSLFIKQLELKSLESPIDLGKSLSDINSLETRIDKINAKQLTNMFPSLSKEMGVLTPQVTRRADRSKYSTADPEEIALSDELVNTWLGNNKEITMNMTETVAKIIDENKKMGEELKANAKKVFKETDNTKLTEIIDKMTLKQKTDLNKQLEELSLSSQKTIEQNELKGFIDLQDGKTSALRASLEEQSKASQDAMAIQNDILELNYKQKLISEKEYNAKKIDIEDKAAKDKVKIDNAILRSELTTSVSRFKQASQLQGDLDGLNRQFFEMYKATSIATTMITTIESAQLAYRNMLAVSWLGAAAMPMAVAAAAVAYAAGIANVQAIAAESFDEGGVTTKAGYYWAGNINEAHIPLNKNRKVPVEIKNGGSKPVIVQQKTDINLNNPVFQDMDTQYETMQNIAKIIVQKNTEKVLINSYKNDGAIRQLIKRGI